MHRCSPSPATTLPAAGSPANRSTITVNFNATAVGIETATLTINSDSPNNPSVVVNLRGIGMNGTEVANGLNEPSLQRILDRFQIPDTVGEDDPTTTARPAQPLPPNDVGTLQQARQSRRRRCEHSTADRLR